jgi:hypothetical protein
MTPLHQLLNMKVDRRDARKGFGSPSGAGLEWSGDPETGASLHHTERVQGTRHAGPFVHPQAAPICSNRENAQVIKESFVLGAKPAHRVTKRQHGPHRGEGLVGVALDVFPECEGSVKEESQVAPYGARLERGGPRVGGIAEINVRVDITVLPREVEPFGFGVLENQAHGLGQFVHDSISSFELREIRFKRGGLRNNSAVVHVRNEKGQSNLSLELLHEGSQSESRDDRGHGGALSQSDTGRERRGQIFVPGILCVPTHEVRPEEHDYFRREPLLL